eukprot:jgi/Sobl393_1/19329/SZX76051.1
MSSSWPLAARQYAGCQHVISTPSWTLQQHRAALLEAGSHPTCKRSLSTCSSSSSKKAVAAAASPAQAQTAQTARALLRQLLPQPHLVTVRPSSSDMQIIDSAGSSSSSSRQEVAYTSNHADSSDPLAQWTAADSSESSSSSGRRRRRQADAAAESISEAHTDCGQSEQAQGCNMQTIDSAGSSSSQGLTYTSNRIDSSDLLAQWTDADSIDIISSSSSSSGRRRRRRAAAAVTSVSETHTDCDQTARAQGSSMDSSASSSTSSGRRRRRRADVAAAAISEMDTVYDQSEQMQGCSIDSNGSSSSSSSSQRLRRRQQQAVEVAAPPDSASATVIDDDQDGHWLLQQQQLKQHQDNQQQQQQAHKVLLLGIDPDTNGAIAVVAADLLPYAQLLPDSCSSSNGGTSINSQQQQQQQQQPLFGVDLQSASVSVYDMPVEVIPLQKKSMSAPQRYRRRLEVPRVIALIRMLRLQQLQQQQAAAQLEGGSSSSMQPPLLRAFLEVSSIMPTNGSLSTLAQGYSIGAWQAVLLALGFEVCSVHAKHWKKGLGLLKADKDDSRALAGRLFAGVGQCQQHIISRKKDHGRAEALLIAAWGCGWGAEQAPGPGRGKAGPANQSGPLQQGPLRDIVQLDGGMHMLASSSSSSSGAGAGGDADAQGPQGAGDAGAALAFVPAGTAKTRAAKLAQQRAKAAPKSRKKGTQPAAEAAAAAAEDYEAVIASSKAGKQPQVESGADGSSSRKASQGTARKRPAAV